MNNTREIRHRIKSVKNIAQITKAMELVSAAKMRKAQAAALASRPYSRLTEDIMKNLLAKVGEVNHPLVSQSRVRDLENKRTLVIVITSDRGLAGALNANVINSAINFAREKSLSDTDFIAVGKKASDASKRLRLNLTAAFPGKDRNITIFDAKSISDIAIGDFLKGNYGKVFVIFTNFISTLKQQPKILSLLPLQLSATEAAADYIFEPSVNTILDGLISRSLEFTIFQALVESVASEHSARMVAMRNANQAASDLIDDLQLSYNQARQATITRELAEISAAKLTLEG